MRKYIRNYVEGGTYFFTIVTKKRKPLFQNPTLCEFFMAGIDKVKSHQLFELVAYCILPDHIHMLISLPEGIKNYSTIIKEIKKSVTSSIRKHLDQQDLLVWQDRFWEHTIRDEHDLQTHYDYIHYNPVKHGYVDAVDQWEWSSMYLDPSDKSIEDSFKQIQALNQKRYSFGE